MKCHVATMCMKDLQTHSTSYRAFHLFCGSFYTATLCPGVHNAPWNRCTRICTYAYFGRHLLLLFFLFLSKLIHSFTGEGRDDKTHTNWSRIQGVRSFWQVVRIFPAIKSYQNNRESMTVPANITIYC